MSTNKTPNYALHSWLPTDDFQLSELNQNFAALDAAARIIHGTYKGTGSDTFQTIELGIQPLLVLVMAAEGPNVGNMATIGLATRTRSGGRSSLSIKETGFEVGIDWLNLNGVGVNAFIYLALVPGA